MVGRSFRPSERAWMGLASGAKRRAVAREDGPNDFRPGIVIRTDTDFGVPCPRDL